MSESLTDASARNRIDLIYYFSVDRTSPVCGQTSDVVETTPLGSPGTVVQFTEPQATDNSGTVTLRSRSHSPGQFFQVGTTEVCYTFADPSQNTVDCCFNVIVTEGEFGHIMILS